jgi:hypothetical protein
LLQRKHKIYNETKRKQAKFFFFVFFSAEHAKPVQIGFCNGSFQIEASFFQTAYLSRMAVKLRMLATLALLLAEKSCQAFAAALHDV